MKIEKHHNGIRYTLSNEDLQEGDKVYPIADGRCLEGGGWILHGFTFKDYCTGFPNEPHTIKKINYSTYKPNQTQTDHGHGPIETYYKIIKMEKQTKTRIHPDSALVLYNYKWVEIDIKIEDEIET
jgi:hypothetical protein